MSEAKTLAQRKAEARAELDEFVERVASCPVCDNLNTPSRKSFEAKRDAHARACIDEAVAPALEYLNGLIRITRPGGSLGGSLGELRRLLTERPGT